MKLATLGLLVLVLAGCSTLHEARINDMQSLTKALDDSRHLDGTISLRNGEVFSGSVLQMNTDTACYMLSESGRIQFIPLNNISGFRYTRMHRGLGALEGYGIAFGIDLPFAMQDFDKSGGGSLFIAGVVAGPIGALVGAIHGQREIFKYQVSDSISTLSGK